MSITYYVRGEFYREKTKDYVGAAISMGASDTSIIFKHILPNSLTPVVSFAPFMIVGKHQRLWWRLRFPRLRPACPNAQLGLELTRARRGQPAQVVVGFLSACCDVHHPPAHCLHR